MESNFSATKLTLDYHRFLHPCYNLPQEAYPYAILAFPSVSGGGLLLSA